MAVKEAPAHEADEVVMEEGQKNVCYRGRSKTEMIQLICVRESKAFFLDRQANKLYLTLCAKILRNFVRTHCSLIYSVS